MRRKFDQGRALQTDENPVAQCHKNSDRNEEPTVAQAGDNGADMQRTEHDGEREDVRQWIGRTGKQIDEEGHAGGDEEDSAEQGPAMPRGGFANSGGARGWR